MTTLPPAGAPPGPAPTWRDLPDRPPYGPVPEPRTPNIHPRKVAAAPAPPTSTFSPGQIAAAVGGTLLLVVVGITAALLLLGGDDDVVAEATPPAVETPPAPDDPPPVDPAPDDPPVVVPLPSPGELEPATPDQAPEAPSPPQPEGGAPTAPAPDGPPDAPQQLPSTPLPPEADDEGVRLPLLFALRTLPAGMAQTSTTVRQTTRDDEVVEEQVTMLDADAGEVTVRATRADDVEDRLGVLLADGAEDVSVAGRPGHLLADGRLVWLLDEGEPTLLEVDAPEGVDTDELLTIATGLELLR